MYKLMLWQELLKEEEISEGLDDILVDIFKHIRNQERKLASLESKVSTYENMLDENEKSEFIISDKDNKLQH